MIELEALSPTTRVIVREAARILANEAKAEIEALAAALDRIAEERAA